MKILLIEATEIDDQTRRVDDPSVVEDVAAQWKLRHDVTAVSCSIHDLGRRGARGAFEAELLAMSKADLVVVRAPILSLAPRQLRRLATQAPTVLWVPENDETTHDPSGLVRETKTRIRDARLGRVLREWHSSVIVVSSERARWTHETRLGRPPSYVATPRFRGDLTPGVRTSGNDCVAIRVTGDVRREHEATCVLSRLGTPVNLVGSAEHLAMHRELLHATASDVAFSEAETRDEFVARLTDAALYVIIPQNAENDARVTSHCAASGTPVLIGEGPAAFGHGPLTESADLSSAGSTKEALLRITSLPEALVERISDHVNRARTIEAVATALIDCAFIEEASLDLVDSPSERSVARRFSHDEASAPAG